MPTPEQLERANVDPARPACSAATATRSSTASRLDEPDRFWRAVRDDLGIPLAARLGRGRRHLARHRVGDVVPRRAAQRRRGVRPPLGGRAARRGGGGLGARGRRPPRRSPGRSCRARCGGSPRRSSSSASGRATRWASSCRWRPRRRSPRTPARTSARSRCRSSPASRRRRSPRGSRTPARRLLITADASLRRGRLVPMKEIADEALAEAPSVEHVLVWTRSGVDCPVDGRAGRPLGGRRRGPARRARRPPSSRPSTRTCSRTRRGRPGGRRARSTSMAASSSRSRARPPTRRT